MERNWDLIREILFRLERKEAGKRVLTAKDFDGDLSHEIGYNVMLLQEAGLIEARILGSTPPSAFFAARLTWSGHELLDAIRDDTIWAKTKRSFLSKGLSMTFDLVKSVAIGIATECLKSGMRGG